MFIECLLVKFFLALFLFLFFFCFSFFSSFFFPLACTIELQQLRQVVELLFFLFFFGGIGIDDSGNVKNYAVHSF
jgi:hypothetical protein